MKQYFYAIAFVMALAVAYAASQTTPQNSATQTPCTATPPAANTTPSTSNNCAPTSRPTTAGSIAGSTQSNTQTGVGVTNSAGASATGAQGSAAVPSGSRGTTPAGPATGSVSSGASSSGGGASSLPQSDIEGAASADAETVNLRTQIQGAIAKEPTLSSDHVLVNVTATTVELSGTATTGKEKQTAVRIAESYANNRKVVDHITVTGRGNAPVAPATPPPSQSSSPQGASANPATPATPQSNQSTQPGKKPVNQGDQSQTVPQR